MSTRAALGFLMAMLLALSARPAAAQGDDPAMRRAARALYEQGVTAASEHRWQDARGAFERSLALFPAAVTRMALAGAQANTGQLVAAAESYRQFLREADAGMRARYEEAVRAALAQLEPRIPSWTVEATGLGDADVVQLDGAPLARPAIGIAIPVDPGAHVVRVLRGEEVLVEASFEATEGGTGQTRLEVPVPASPVEVVAAPIVVEPTPDAPATTTVDLTSAPEPARQQGRDDALWIALGVAGGVLVVGAIVLGLAVALSSGGGADPIPMGNVGPIMTF